MPVTLSRFCTAARLRLLVWLLVVVVPLNATAAATLTARGPLHHHAAAPASLRLLDFRRQPAGHPATPRHAHVLFGLAHAAATPLRHFHAAGDASVVRSADDLAAQSDAIDAGSTAGSSLAAFLALLPATPALAAFDATQRHAAAPRCAFSTRYPPRLERPPRTA